MVLITIHSIMSPGVLCKMFITVQTTTKKLNVYYSPNKKKVPMLHNQKIQNCFGKPNIRISVCWQTFFNSVQVFTNKPMYQFDKHTALG